MVQPDNIVYTLTHRPGGAALYVTVGVTHGYNLITSFTRTHRPGGAALYVTVGVTRRFCCRGEGCIPKKKPKKMRPFRVAFIISDLQD